MIRLVALQARADVLVDGHWLSALARAQRRMGFKHGTALLTSDELASPISWGLMRPGHPAQQPRGRSDRTKPRRSSPTSSPTSRGMDWIKLLLARVATALFWFNPLVWMLAREAHQLREEAADDSVLAADIVDTDYAQLLVGVARHECPGLLLGAHGVAPSKSSLARRVARVLDGKSVRGPVARCFAFGVFAGAVLVAAPLAALTLTPAAPKAPKRSPSARRERARGQPYMPQAGGSDRPAAHHRRGRIDVGRDRRRRRDCAARSPSAGDRARLARCRATMAREARARSAGRSRRRQVRDARAAKRCDRRQHAQTADDSGVVASRDARLVDDASSR